MTKHELLDRFWPEVHVTDNTLARAIADIRKVLGDDAASPRYIQTASRRGYASSLPRVVRPNRSKAIRFRSSSAAAALESLDVRRLAETVGAFEHVVAAMPQYAPAHVALASARLLQYEGTRASNMPRREWLDQAVSHARRACVLDAKLGEASTLGFVCDRACTTLASATLTFMRILSAITGSYSNPSCLPAATNRPDRRRPS